MEQIITLDACMTRKNSRRKLSTRPKIIKTKKHCTLFLLDHTKFMEEYWSFIRPLIQRRQSSYLLSPNHFQAFHPMKVD